MSARTKELSEDGLLPSHLLFVNPWEGDSSNGGSGPGVDYAGGGFALKETLNFGSAVAAYLIRFFTCMHASSLRRTRVVRMLTFFVSYCPFSVKKAAGKAPEPREGSPSTQKRNF